MDLIKHERWIVFVEVHGKWWDFVSYDNEYEKQLMVIGMNRLKLGKRVLGNNINYIIDGEIIFYLN